MASLAFGKFYKTSGPAEQSVQDSFQYDSLAIHSRVRDALCDCPTVLGAFTSSSRQGRIDNSPPFQRWVVGGQAGMESR